MSAHWRSVARSSPRISFTRWPGGLGTFTFGDPRTATLKGLDGSFDLRPVLG
jgi:hypothetical protein